MKKKFLFKSLIGAALIGTAALGLAGCTNSGGNATTESSVVEPIETSTPESKPTTPVEEKKFTVTLVTDYDLETKSYTVPQGSVIKLPKLEEDGYKFLGWYTEDGDIVNGVTPIFVDMELYPKFEIIPTNVTINIEGNNYTYSSEATLKEISNGNAVQFYAVNNSGDYWPVSTDTKIKDLNPNVSYSVVYSNNFDDIASFYQSNLAYPLLAEGFGFDPSVNPDQLYESCYMMVSSYLSSSNKASEFNALSELFFANLKLENPNISAVEMFDRYSEFVKAYAEKNKDDFESYLSNMFSVVMYIQYQFNYLKQMISCYFQINTINDIEITDEAWTYLNETLSLDLENMSYTEIVLKIYSIDFEKMIESSRNVLNEETQRILLTVMTNYEAINEFASYNNGYHNGFSSQEFDENVFRYVLKNSDINVSTIYNTVNSYYKLYYKCGALAEYTYNDLEYYLEYDFKVDAINGIFDAIDEYIDSNPDAKGSDNYYESLSMLTYRYLDAFYSISECSLYSDSLLEYFKVYGFDAYSLAYSTTKTIMNNDKYWGDSSSRSSMDEEKISDYIEEKLNSLSSLYSIYESSANNYFNDKYYGSLSLSNDIKAKEVSKVYCYDEKYGVYLVFSGVSDGKYQYAYYDNVMGENYALATFDSKAKTLTVISEAVYTKYNIEYKKKEITKAEYEKLSSNFYLTYTYYYDKDVNCYISFYLDPSYDQKENKYYVELKYNGYYFDSTEIYYLANSTTVTVDLAKKDFSYTITSDFKTKYTLDDKYNLIAYELQDSNYAYIYERKDNNLILWYWVDSSGVYYDGYSYATDYVESYLFYYYECTTKDGVVTIDYSSTLDDDAYLLDQKYNGVSFTLDKKYDSDSQLYCYDSDLDCYIIFKYYYTDGNKSYYSYNGLTKFADPNYSLCNADFEKNTLTVDVSNYDKVMNKYLHAVITGESSASLLYTKVEGLKYDLYIVYNKTANGYKYYYTTSSIYSLMDEIKIDFTTNKFTVITKADKSKYLDYYKDYTFKVSNEITDDCELYFSRYIDNRNVYFILGKTKDGYKVVDVEGTSIDGCSCGISIKDKEITLTHSNHSSVVYDLIAKKNLDKTLSPYGDKASVVYVPYNDFFVKYNYVEKNEEGETINSYVLDKVVNSIDDTCVIGDYYTEEGTNYIVIIRLTNTEIIKYLESLTLKYVSSYGYVKFPENAIYYVNYGGKIAFVTYKEGKLKVNKVADEDTVNYNYGILLSLDEEKMELTVENVGSKIICDYSAYRSLEFDYTVDVETIYVVIGNNYEAYQFNSNLGKYEWGYSTSSPSSNRTYVTYADGKISYEKKSVSLIKYEKLVAYDKTPITIKTTELDDMLLNTPGYVVGHSGSCYFVIKKGEDGKWYRASDIMSSITEEYTVVSIDTDSDEGTIEKYGTKSKAQIEEIKALELTSDNSLASKIYIKLGSENIPYIYNSEKEKYVFDSEASSVGEYYYSYATIDIENKILKVLYLSVIDYQKTFEDKTYTIDSISSLYFINNSKSILIPYAGLKGSSNYAYIIKYSSSKNAFIHTGGIVATQGRTDIAIGHINGQSIIIDNLYDEESSYSSYILRDLYIENGSSEYIGTIRVYDSAISEYLRFDYDSSKNAYSSWYATDEDYYVTGYFKDGKIVLDESVVSAISYVKSKTFTIDDKDAVYDEGYLLEYNGLFFNLSGSYNSMTLGISHRIFTGTTNANGGGGYGNDIYKYSVGKIKTSTETAATVETTQYAYVLKKESE